MAILAAITALPAIQASFAVAAGIVRLVPGALVNDRGVLAGIGDAPRTASPR